MAEETKPIKLKFADEQQSPTLELANGDYLRKFDAKDQPFEITGVSHTEKGDDDKERTVVDMTAEDEAAFLLRTGLFVENEAESKAQSPKPKVLGRIGGAPAESISSEQ